MKEFKYDFYKRLIKNALCITRGHKTCRFQWVFERFGPPQAFATADSDAAPQSGTFHTAVRCV